MLQIILVKIKEKTNVNILILIYLELTKFITFKLKYLNKRKMCIVMMGKIRRFYMIAERRGTK